MNHNRRLRNSLNNRNGNRNSLGTKKSHRPDEKKKRVEFKKGGRSECGKCENFSAVWGVDNPALQLSESLLSIVRLLVIFLGLIPTITKYLIPLLLLYLLIISEQCDSIVPCDARDLHLKMYCHLKCPQPPHR
ncbi:uncharacterized protein EURHEDRAFT_31936 [Aspergillus ruber CBS 135680]|uniref:Uncharacterized protein n=1 Tax=Aspergillus ruber (strain CBS 135680) TaxID=1388766 RepID=A0A017SU74_ASPRC|nr:uncharacterized protein EURHEDRAFT_31936 [Aspergillus ruber CBS 135680]EYE99855.1 hypothetical protein EURHEDRAFT_31936 [Aspergillus ruber CBS 135680]